jgi:asparagine synthase (glutamine-hydrolysing)
MCGINGILRLSPEAPPIDPAELLRTRDAMARRGPDGYGAYLADDGRVGLAHRRLAILDPSPAGAQPMASDDGRYRIVLNGEIYNFRALRGELPGHCWRSESDTEVLLALYARHGAAMLPLLRGMFALAIWDERERRLLLARDPLGVKPLYYAVAPDGACLRFASQVKALEAGGAVALDVDPAGLAGFLLWGSVPEPWTIRRAVRALPAGTYLEASAGRPGEPVAYGPVSGSPGSPAGPTAGASGPDLAAALAESVRDHLVSDVPVAVFLSAGLDSGLILALARRAHPAASSQTAPLLAFTLSFDAFAGTPRDEAPLAAEVARRLGARHVVRRVGRDDFRALFGEAVAAMDQPSIDGFNTFVVARAAHEAGIKVALSGLGGDELMGSYPSFADVPRGARAARWGARLPAAAALWPAIARRAAPGRPKLAGLLRHGRTLAGAYFLRRGLFLPEELPALLGREPAAAALAAYDPVADAGRALPPAADGRPADPWLAVQALETARYMRNQLLRDADWASMASSLELRVPLADARLAAAFAAGGFAAVRRMSKAGLVRQVAPELPEALFQRPKSGFYMPVTEWLEDDPANGSRPGSRASAAMGCRSRRLARRVLAEMGIELGTGEAAA